MSQNNKKIPIELNQEEYTLIMYYRKVLRFGRSEVITHSGKPVNLIVKEIRVDLKNADLGEKTLDKNIGLT